MAASGRTPDAALILIVIAIVLFGLVALSSASTVVSYQQYHDSAYLLKRQLLSILIGVLAFAAMYRINLALLRRWALPLLIGSIALLVAVFIPGIGLELLGARRWIHFGSMTVQPSEFVKLAFLIYLARWLEERRTALHDRAYGLWPFLALLGLVALLILQQPDLGTMGIITAIALSSYFVAGGPIRDFLLIGGLAVTGFVVLVKTAPYRAARFLVFLNPQLDPQGIGYHINQALLAIGTGGLFGLGLGHSRQKFNYLPEAAGDSIFAIVAEELGLIIATGLVILYAAFLVRGYAIARRAPDTFTKVVATGITTWIGFQALMNMAALSGIVPLTGVPLPFVSYGGTAIIVSLAGVGLLANISRGVR